MCPGLKSVRFSFLFIKIGKILPYRIMGESAYSTHSHAAYYLLCDSRLNSCGLVYHPEPKGQENGLPLANTIAS